MFGVKHLSTSSSSSGGGGGGGSSLMAAVHCGTPALTCSHVRFFCTRIFFLRFYFAVSVN